MTLAFLDSTTAVIDAILTKKGRELLAKNDGSFQITKFAFGDDEINYQLYDATRATGQDSDILNLPILEPVSNEDVALLYRLVSLPTGTLKISTLKITPQVATTDFGDDLTFNVITENGTDNQGYAATSRDLSIAKLENLTAQPDDNGVATFTVKTGENAGGSSGTTIIDVTGINTGARRQLTITVNASGV